MNNSQYSSGYSVAVNDLLGWVVKVRHLLSSVCGPDSQHFTQFVAAEEPGMYVTNYEIFQKLRAVLEAAKEDYEGGYLNSLKLLVQAEVFDNELEMASELLTSGYVPAAAVTAGVVLEAGLREMCVDKGIPIGNLNKMNADLAKAGVFNKLVQKQVTALADIRNNAAHGHYDQFSKEDVASMIKDVQRILASRTN
ncbi:DUF4145 domain-containing protein [Bradyrhizobium sp. AUGA SZCCT0177]|nr:DUF4145 domain-containing protein [Bradyrhizobium sp. AUGA SZCCT0177]